MTHLNYKWNKSKVINKYQCPHQGQCHRLILRSHGQIFWYGWKGLDTRKTHAKFESPMSNGLKIIKKVKILCHRQTNKQTDTQTSKQTEMANTICPHHRFRGHKTSVNCSKFSFSQPQRDNRFSGDSCLTSYAYFLYVQIGICYSTGPY